MLRFIIAMLAVGLFLTFGSVLLLYIKSIQDTERKNQYTMKFVKGIFRILLWITGTRYEVEGLENIPENEAVLYIGNHRSIFDVIIGYMLVKGPTGFVAKMEIRKVVTLRWWMEEVNCLFIDRDDLKQSLQVILEAIKKVKSGVSIWIYPEGTRSRGADPAELLPFKEGSFKIAEKSGCKIIPVAMLGTEEIWEAQKPRICRKRVKVRIGEPIEISALPKEDAKRIGMYTRERLIGMIWEMQAEQKQEEK